MRTAAILVLAAKSAAAQPAQKFEGARGSLRESLEVTGSGGALHATLDVGGQGCGGEAKGPVTCAADGTLTMTRADDGTECRVTIAIHGGVAVVKDGGCDQWHGASCDFNGTLKAVR